MTNGNRIGVLTLHSSYNEGAILQAFCIATNLQNSLPNSKVEIVDHRYPAKVRAYGPVHDDRTKVLRDFIDYSLPLSERQFLADDHVATFEFMREKYNVLITGSDEFWKLRYSRRFWGLLAEQKHPSHPAFPNVYWPDTTIRMPKIAYAASIGQTDWRTIPRRHIEKMRGILSDYTLLGIRDQRTLSFLKWLDPAIADRAEWVPDPTFSTDILSLIDTEMLKEKLQQWGVDFGRPRICIVLENCTKANLVGLSLSNRISDVELFDKGLSPLEWVGVFGLMDYCISQRMHACISCILNDTPFIGIDIGDDQMDYDTKLRDLMRSFDLLAYYYSDEKDSPEKLMEIIENLSSKPWQVGKIAQKRLLFRNRSREFTEKIKEILRD
jgi:hypothetical protein